MIIGAEKPSGIWGLLITAFICLSGCTGLDSERDAVSGKDPSVWEIPGEPGIHDPSAEGEPHMECPDGWTEYANAFGSSLMFVSEYESLQDNFKENINLFVEDISDNPMCIDDYFCLALEKLDQACREYPLVDLVLLENEQASMGKYEARRIVYTFSVEKAKTVRFKFLQNVTVVNGKGYVVTYGAEEASFDTYLPKVVESVDSFELR